MMHALPSRLEALRKIENLSAGLETRESVASWAFSIIDDDTVEATDQAMWNLLTKLGGVDLLDPNGGYLYKNDDLEDWKRELLATQQESFK